MDHIIIAKMTMNLTGQHTARSSRKIVKSLYVTVSQDGEKEPLLMKGGVVTEWVETTGTPPGFLLGIIVTLPHLHFLLVGVLTLSL